MKTAEQWLADKQWCERQTSPNTGNFTVYGIEAIQADALEHATQLLTAHADSQQRGFEAVYREMLALRGIVKLTGTATPWTGQELHKIWADSCGWSSVGFERDWETMHPHRKSKWGALAAAINERER